MRARGSGWRGLAWGWAFAVACAGARAEEGAKPSGQPQADAAPPPVVVQIDVAETVDGKVSKANYATYFLRKKLREYGFAAWSVRMLPIFEKLHAKALEKARAAGRPEPELLERTQPKPELIVRGRVSAELARTSTFYGQDLAFVYKTEVVLEVLDADGTSLAKIRFEDEFGRRDKKLARRDTLRRAGLFAAAEVLMSDPLRERLSEAQRSAVAAWAAKIEAKRKDKSSSGEQAR